MTPAQITGSTFRGGLLRGAIAGAVALLVVYGVLFLTSDEQTAAAQAPCEKGTAVANPAANPGLVSDCAILLAAKDTLRGTETLNWSADTAIDDWEGIAVSGTPRRVTELDIDGWNSETRIGRDILLRGTVPAQLGGLSKLRRLVLSRNALTGAIPAELGNLSELTDLHLYSNQLTGGIPPELGLLPNLARLDLSRNQLSGGIPVELGQLSNLRSLRLHNNQLTGSVPASLGDLRGLRQLNLAGNTMLSGCIPVSLRGINLNDLSSLSLAYCTTTTTYSLTTSMSEGGRISPLAGTYSYLSGASVTVTATPDAGWRIASWGDDCSASGTATTCPLTMNANKTASVTFARITHTLTVTAGEGGAVTPGGTTTHNQGDVVTLTASWNDATHSFTGWGGDCDGTATTCALTMDGAKTVTATFAALAADRCATPTDSDCIVAVYLGAPGDYAQAVDIPADVLLTPAADGRYYVERGQQYTVITAAPLPAGWTRFWLEWSPLEFGTPSPVSASQLIKPVGTTYTFTVTEDEAAASTLITFDLKQARPFIRPRPDGKPEIGDTVVTTVFSVVNCESGVAVPNPTANTELVEDCKSLLKAKDRLAGTATLNWSVGRAMTNWEGVTVAGTPQRVTQLELASSGLTGELTGLLGNLTALTHLRLNGNALTGRIPSKLQLQTALTHLYLANDALTGCWPTSLRNVTNNDLATLNLPDCAPPRVASGHGRKLQLAGGQTVSYQRLGRGPFLVVDLPEGYTFTIESALSESPGGPSSVIAVVVTNEGGYKSRVVFDRDTGRETYRGISGIGGIFPDGRTVGDDARRLIPLHHLNDVFDRISESAWLESGW